MCIKGEVMDFYNKSIENSIKILNSNKVMGLGLKEQKLSAEKFGKNLLSKRKKQTFIARFFSALKEPMLLILLFSLVIAFGTNLGKLLKTGQGDFSECVGILVAVSISVIITLIMEGSSEKAFELLNGIYDNILVKVIRSGEIITIKQQDVLVGDILIVESGDKIIADGRLIESQDLLIDESALTGESQPLRKDASKVYSNSLPLAERKNCVYSGTFVVGGNGKILVTDIGDKTVMGSIAGELSQTKEKDSPLQSKLAKLGKIITTIGACTAVIVFIISAVRLYVQGSLSFDSIQELFISCIVLIVAAVPEGLPTIVAVSLALNMIKLAKSNALIKKMTATETAGAVSIICSDKTGTLTQNKMRVVSICYNNACSENKSDINEVLKQNFVLNSTADIIKHGKSFEEIGSATECALLYSYQRNKKHKHYIQYRKDFQVLDRQPFSSQTKFMTTTIAIADKKRTLLKGAGEIVLDMCQLSIEQKNIVKNQMSIHQKMARRVICFAHKDDSGVEGFIYDGFVAIADPVRKEAYKAVYDCKKAGIKVKILTGDNKITAYAIAKELKVAEHESQVIECSELERLDDESLKKILPKIRVIARSTPSIKLRVVRVLKSMGEVVAVTGDGINDAPAIRHADVGFAMGISGSDISKEAADIVLLDDSFATVVKSIAFGRNVYKNLQRFILFQLSVNLSALLFITVCAIMNLPSPFNTLQLLWINLIMDGPPALTLVLESANSKVMNYKPVKRTDGIVGLSMLLRMIFNGVFVAFIMITQYLFNFLHLDVKEMSGGLFTLFIMFQLFNAFNCRELGYNSIFRGIGKNKIMVITFGCVFLLHFIIVQVLYKLFAVSPLCLLSWLKIISISFTIVLVSELYKLIYRKFVKDKRRFLVKGK